MKIRNIVAIVAVTLAAGSCNQQDDGLQQDERVPILLKATVEDAAKGPTHTRAATTATTQNTEFLNGQKVKVWIKENDGSHTAWIKNPIEYKVVNDYDDDDDDGDLDPITDTTPFFFPVGVNTISMYGVHPSSYTSNTDFTVATDQTSDADYAASDLCYSPATNHTRTTGPVDSNGRQVVTFQHALSKIVVEITTNTGKALPSTVKLLAKKTTKMTWSTGSDFSVQAEATGDASYITMGLNPNTAGDKVSGGAIIPPQTIADGTSFISFTVDDLGPMIYPLPANTTFTSGKRYIYDIRVKNVGIDVTTTVTDWDRNDETQNNIIRAQQLDLIKNLPLYYVDEYNVITASSSNLTTDFMLASNLNEGYFWQWNSAASDGGTLYAPSYFGPTSGFNPSSNYDSYYTRPDATNLPGHHLPILSEWLSIAPSISDNLFGYAPTLNTGVLKSNYITPKWGTNETTKAGVSETSYFYPTNITNGSRVLWAVRFLGTDYCSIWKYQQRGGWTASDYGYVTISAKWLDKEIYTSSYVQSNMATIINNISWGDLTESDLTGDDVVHFVCRRTFYALGWATGVTLGSATANGAQGVAPCYWSATRNASDQAHRFCTYPSSSDVFHTTKLSSFNIRLFRDN